MGPASYKERVMRERALKAETDRVNRPNVDLKILPTMSKENEHSEPIMLRNMQLMLRPIRSWTPEVETEGTPNSNPTQVAERVSTENENSEPNQPGDMGSEKSPAECEQTQWEETRGVCCPNLTNVSQSLDTREKENSQYSNKECPEIASLSLQRKRLSSGDTIRLGCTLGCKAGKSPRSHSESSHKGNMRKNENPRYLPPYSDMSPARSQELSPRVKLSTPSHYHSTATSSRNEDRALYVGPPLTIDETIEGEPESSSVYPYQATPVVFIQEESNVRNDHPTFSAPMTGFTPAKQQAMSIAKQYPIAPAELIENANTPEIAIKGVPVPRSEALAYDANIIRHWPAAPGGMGIQHTPGPYLSHTREPIELRSNTRASAPLGVTERAQLNVSERPERISLYPDNQGTRNHPYGWSLKALRNQTHCAYLMAAIAVELYLVAKHTFALRSNRPDYVSPGGITWSGDDHLANTQGLLTKSISYILDSETHAYTDNFFLDKMEEITSVCTTMATFYRTLYAEAQINLSIQSTFLEMKRYSEMDRNFISAFHPERTGCPSKPEGLQPGAQLESAYIIPK